MLDSLKHFDVAVQSGTGLRTCVETEIPVFENLPSS